MNDVAVTWLAVTWLAASVITSLPNCTYTACCDDEGCYLVVLHAGRAARLHQANKYIHRGACAGHRWKQQQLEGKLYIGSRSLCSADFGVSTQQCIRYAVECITIGHGLSCACYPFVIRRYNWCCFAYRGHRLLALGRQAGKGRYDLAGMNNGGANPSWHTSHWSSTIQTLVLCDGASTSPRSLFFPPC